MFHAPVAVRTGENVERDGFVFTDLLPLPFPESLCHSCAAALRGDSELHVHPLPALAEEVPAPPRVTPTARDS